MPGDGGSDPSGPVPTDVDVDPRSLVALGAAAALAAAVWAVVTIAPDTVTRLAVGALVGLALSPVVTSVQRRTGRSRGSAATLVGIVLAAGFALVALLVAPPAISQAREFSDELPATVQEAYSWPVVGSRLRDADAAGRLDRAIDDLPARVDDEALADLGQRLLGGALSTVVVLVAALGVLVDGEHLVRRIRAAIPASRRARADEIGRVVSHSFGSYFAGSLLVAVLAGLVVLIVGLALGVPLAPVAALWAMLTNLIPQVGGFLGGSFFVLLALTDGPLTAVLAGVVFLAYQQFENNVLGPAIVGTAVNLTPPTTMLAALVGGAAAGVPGALVATPLIGAAKALYLESRGQLPPERPPLLTRRLRRRVERPKAKVEEAGG